MNKPFPAPSEVVATLFAAALAVSMTVTALPATAYVAEPDTFELEAAFWSCDYNAARFGADTTQASDCISITDELKTKRFGGSFELLLDWWSENKLEKYAELDRGENERLVASVDLAGFPESI